MIRTIKVFDQTLIVYGYTQTMGIKGLTRFLRTKYPDVWERIHITEYAYEKIAIDVSVYLYKFRARRGDAWLGSFINLVACLRKNQIHCVFVYDTGAVPEKQRTKDERAKSRNKTKCDTELIENGLLSFEAEGTFSSELYAKHQQVKGNHSRPPRLLGPLPRVDDQDVYRDLEQELTRLKNMFPKPSDYILTKELFDILKVPWIDAPMEAETMCSDFCKGGIVGGVLSEDSDVIAYGSPVFLPALDIGTGECDRIHYDRVLEALDMTPEMFLDFCIMCGNDYNPNILHVGPVQAFSLIKTYKSIENISDNTKHDVTVLNHVRSRELLTVDGKSGVTVPYCAQPDFPKLKEFMDHHGVSMSMATLKEAFAHKKITFSTE